MKVGIITFHFAQNYGAMIQAYAMQTVLEKMGHQVFIIDYAPEYHLQWFKRGISWKTCLIPSFIPCYRAVMNKIRHSKATIERYDNFNSFYHEKFNLYPYNNNDDMSFFDAVLLGSDQIWNIGLTGNSFDYPYFGVGFKCKVFSYAASAMYNKLSTDEERMFTLYLNNLNGIGVREIALRNLLQPLVSKQIHVNLDPTLLLGIEDFNNLDLNNPMNCKYVLVYELQPDPTVREIALNYANSNGLKIVFLTGNIFYNTNNGYDLTASPEKFLAYIKNAQCVITTSFHGTALSLVFKRNFFTIKHGNKKDDRVKSLLSQLVLESQFIDKALRPTNCNINYNAVEERISLLKKDSIEYLKSMLS